MTTAAIELRDAIATDLFATDDFDLLTKLRKYQNKLKAKFAAKAEEECISKEEILVGIDAGLKEMKMGLGRPARDFLNGLQ
jgi:hypothetical protein